MLLSHRLRLLQPSLSHHDQYRRSSNPFPWLHCPNFPTLTTEPVSLSLSNSSPCSFKCKLQSNPSTPLPPTTSPQHENNNNNNCSNFWAAVGLIVGTAVGPGMLGLPAAAARAGPIPSTAAIILSWVYVVSSIILVAELSFVAMEESGAREVSFTALATSAFGPRFGAFVALVYAALSFSLLIACVSGIGSLILQQFPLLNPVVAHSIVPCLVGIVLQFFRFAAIDIVNRMLCMLMLCSITALLVVGFSVGRSNLIRSFSFACWMPEAILPAIPVTVLTLGFHVITPFVCMVVGDSIYNARKAILFGGAVPLAMVLPWNLVVLGLAGSGSNLQSDPIKLLLSVNASALPAVQGFAFAALATSFIGYAVSFPKQLADTVNLIAERFGRSLRRDPEKASPNDYLNKNMGKSSFSDNRSGKINGFVTWLVLTIPIFIASFFRTAFVNALDFAGVYANCFLFGVLPPAMAFIIRSRNQRYNVL